MQDEGARIGRGVLAGSFSLQERRYSKQHVFSRVAPEGSDLLGQDAWMGYKDFGLRLSGRNRHICNTPTLIYPYHLPKRPVFCFLALRLTNTSSSSLPAAAAAPPAPDDGPRLGFFPELFLLFETLLPPATFFLSVAFRLGVLVGFISVPFYRCLCPALVFFCCLLLCNWGSVRKRT